MPGNDLLICFRLLVLVVGLVTWEWLLSDASPGFRRWGWLGCLGLLAVAGVVGYFLTTAHAR